MGRPATKSGEIVSVNINGRGAAWCDGVFSGDREIVEHAQKVAQNRFEVLVNGAYIVASSEDAVGAYAALYSFNPYQTVVIEGTDGVFDAELMGISWDNPDEWMK